MNTVDFVTGWTSLWAMAPKGLGTALATIGVAIVVWFVISWAWQKRKGGQGGLGGFPWMAVLIGSLLAGPAVVFPALLGLLGAVVNMGIAAINFFVAMFP